MSETRTMLGTQFDEPAQQREAATVGLAALFLGIKGYEYRREYLEHHVPWLNFDFANGPANNAKMFFYLYFLMTGLHALHVFIGILVLGTMALRMRRFSENYFTP